MTNTMKMMSRWMTAAAAMLSVAAAQAGTFTEIQHDKAKNIKAYAYTGTIEMKDVETYKHILSQPEYAMIFVNSPGGQWVAGLELGYLTLKHRGDVTIVVDKAYSAAGMWAMADDDQTWVDEKSELGLHLPYVNKLQASADNFSISEEDWMTVGHKMGKFFEHCLGDEDLAEGMMDKLSSIRASYGKQAMWMFNGAGKDWVKKY